jgi:hypothetical protein
MDTVRSQTRLVKQHPLLAVFFAAFAIGLFGFILAYALAH